MPDFLNIPDLRDKKSKNQKGGSLIIFLNAQVCLFKLIKELKH